MQGVLKGIVALFIGLACVPFAARGAAVSGEAAVATDTSANWMKDHLSIGTRITHFVLKDEDKETFLGSINHLGDEQDYLPYKLYADYTFCPYGGIELTWDRVAALARTEADDNHTDGKFVLNGPILTAYGKYPNETCCTPFAGIGFSYFMADFEAQNWWKYGYSSPEDYVALGSVNEPRNGHSRRLDPDDAIGLVLTAGSDFKINDHWSADVYFRYMDISSDVQFDLLSNGVVTQDKGKTSIPFDNYAFGAGVKYVF